MYSADPRLRRTASSVIVLDKELLKPIGAIGFTQQEFRSAPRAELEAIVTARKRTTGFAVAWVDAMYVVKGVVRMGISHKHRYHQEVWDELALLFEEVGPFDIKHILSHRPELVGTISSPEAFVANDAADKVADFMAEKVQPSVSDKARVDSIDAKANLVLRRIRTVGKAIVEHNEASRRSKVVATSSCEVPPPPKVSVAAQRRELLFRGTLLSGHKVER